MPDPVAVMALILTPGKDPESELVMVDQMDRDTVSLELPDGMLVVVEARELRRAISLPTEKRNAA